MHNEYHTVIYIEFGFTLMPDALPGRISARGLNYHPMLAHDRAALPAFLGGAFLIGLAF